MLFKKVFTDQNFGFWIKLCPNVDLIRSTLVNNLVFKRFEKFLKIKNLVFRVKVSQNLVLKSFYRSKCYDGVKILVIQVKMGHF